MRRSLDSASLQSDPQEALDRLLKAAEEAGPEGALDHAEAIAALGQDALEERGDVAFAELCLEEALQLEPDCEEAIALAQAIDAFQRGEGGTQAAPETEGEPEAPSAAAVPEPAPETEAQVESEPEPEPQPEPEPERSDAERFRDLLRAFAAHPGDLEIRARLIDLAQQADFEAALVERWQELLDGESDPALADSLREGLVALLEKIKRRAIRQENEAEERRLTLRIAGLLRGSNPERALSLYTSVLESRPEDPEAKAGLIGLWRDGEQGEVVWETLDRFLARGGDHETRLSLREERLERTVEPEARWKVLREIRTLSEEVLEAPARAFDAAARAFAEGSSEAERHLERLAKAAGKLRELCELLEMEAAKRDGREARDLRARAAGIYEEELGDLGAAAARYESILASDPEDREAMEGLERAYRVLGRHRDLADLFERRIASDASPEERRRTLLKLARLQLDELEDEAAAVESYRRILEMDPGDKEAFAPLVLLLESGRRFGELASLYESRIAHEEKKGAQRESRELKVALAKVVLRSKGEPREAFTLFRGVLEEEPRHLGALAALEQIVEVEEGWRKVEAARLLAPIFLEEREFSRAVPLLEILAGAEEEPAEKAKLYLEIAEIHTRSQPQPALAFVAASRALRAHPESQEALDAIHRMAERASLEEELVELLDEIAHLAGDPASRKRLYLALARAAETTGEPSRALSAYQEARAIDPQDRSILEAEVRLHAKIKDGPGYVEALRALLPKADEAEARRIHLEIAKVQEEWMGDLPSAWETLVAYQDRWPGEVRVLEAMESIATRRERWSDLDRVLEKRLALEKGPGRTEIQLRLAALRERHLLDREGALRIYAGILEANPGHDEALERLELLLENDPGNHAITEVMEKAYRARMDWPSLCDLFEHRVSFADRGARKALLLELAELRMERQNRPDLAFLALHRAFREDPTDRSLWPRIATIAKAADTSGEWIASAEEELDRFTNASAAADLSIHLAELLEKEGDLPAAEMLWERALAFDAERTIEHHRQALAKNPRNASLRERLAGIYESRERYGELAELLAEGIERAVEPRERVGLHLRLAALRRDRLGDPEGAISEYRAALERDPRNRQALEALRGLHALRGEDEALEEVLRRLLPLQEGSAEVKAVRLELFECLVRQEKRAEAVEAAVRILDLPPHRKDELLRLEAVLGEWKAHAERIRVLEALIALEADGGVARLREIARLWRDELKRAQMAAQALERLLELHPADEEAFTELRAIYLQAADYRRYAAATERFTTAIPDGRTKVELLVDLAKVQEERLGQRELAFAKLAAALGIAPWDDAVLRAISELAERGSMFEELAMVLESVAEEAGDEARALWLLRGKLLDERLDEPGEAEASFRRVLAQDPYHPEALAALERLFERRGDSRLAEILEKQIEIASTPEEKQAKLLRLGKLYEKEGKLDLALEEFRRAFDFDPSNEASAAALRALLEREGRFDELVVLLGRLRDLSPSREEKIAREREIAEIYELRLDDDASAIAAHARILEIDPENLPALDALERLYTAADRAAELLRTYDRKLALTGDQPKEQVRIYLKASSIWDEKLGNLPNAIACLENALALEPENLTALRGLAHLLRAEEQWARLAEVYQQQEALLARDPKRLEERVEIWTRLGDLYLNELHQIDRAEQAYRRAYELDEGAKEAIAGLGAIYERTGNWTDALQLLEQQAARAGQGPEAVELFHRIGRIHREMLLDLEAAKTAFQKARAFDPGHLPSIQALKEIARDLRDDEGYLEYLLQEAAYAREPETKAERFHEAGLFQLGRGAKEGAIRYFEEALRCHPRHLEAARKLYELRLAREDWEGAERALDVLCENLSPGSDAVELLSRLCALGAVCERRENRPKAMQSYARAYELDPTHLPAAEGLARAMLATGDSIQALKIYQNILIHHRDSLSEPELVEIHHTIGKLRGRLGDRAAALKSLRTALELDDEHLPTLRSFIEFAEEEGQFEEALRKRHRLLKLLHGSERQTLLRSTAKLAREKLGAPEIAIESLVAYLREAPGDVEVMEELLELYRETRQAARAIELLERMLKTPAAKGSPKRAAGYHKMLGELHRDEGRSASDWLEKAALHFEAALNLDWRQTEAFSALEKMLVGARKWTLLEESYLRMIERLSGKVGYEKARTSLFRNLADLYHEVLSRPAEAVKAYKAVVALDPSDTVARERYAELVAQDAGSEEEAIRAYRKLLAVPESRVAAAKALVKLHAKRKALDEAYVAAQVVSHLLGEGGRDEEGILARLRGFARDSTEENLTEEDFKQYLYHADAHAPTAAIFELIYREAGAGFAAGLHDVKVQGKSLRISHERDRVDTESSMLFFANAFRYVCATLGIAPPVVYRSEEVVGLAVAGTYPLCLVAGPDMFSDQRRKKELYFLLARSLVFTRPAFAFASLLRRDELQIVLEAALSLGEPRFEPTSEPARVQEAKERIEAAMGEEARSRLSLLAKESVGKRLSLRRYAEAVEFTAARAGALLGGDLQVASRALVSEGGAGGRLSLEPLVEDLAIFCLSENFTELRRKLGLSISLPG